MLCVDAVVNGAAVSNLTVPISVQVQRFLQERLPGAGFLGGWDYVLMISFRGDQTHPLRLCGPLQPLHWTPHTLLASVLEDPAPLQRGGRPSSLGSHFVVRVGAEGSGLEAQRMEASAGGCGVRGPAPQLEPSGLP